MLKLRHITVVIVLLLELFTYANIFAQGLSGNDDDNFDRFRPAVSIFIQPTNLFGYYPRMNLGLAFTAPNGINISLMTAIKFIGTASAAEYYTVRELRPEISYFLLKPHYKINIRVGLEFLFTKITEKRLNNSYLIKDQNTVYYSSATRIEKRKGARVIVAMVLASSPSFVFEPYIGLGYALRNCS